MCTHCSVSFVVVCVLTLIGTCYDIILRYKVLRRTDAVNNGGNVTLSTLRSNRKHDRKVTITISKLWTVKTHNSSLGNMLYTVLCNINILQC